MYIQLLGNLKVQLTLDGNNNGVFSLDLFVITIKQILITVCIKMWILEVLFICFFYKSLELISLPKPFKRLKKNLFSSFYCKSYVHYTFLPTVPSSEFRFPISNFRALFLILEDGTTHKCDFQLLNCYFVMVRIFDYDGMFYLCNTKPLLNKMWPPEPFN